MSDLDPNSYRKESVSRWDRLDYTKQQTAEEHYLGNAWIPARRLMIMRIFCIFLSFVLIFFMLTACTPIQKDGISAYDKYTCTVELTANLFPSDDFLELFPYENGDYHYLDTDDWMWGYVKVFSYLRYNPDTYAEAKQYCLDTFVLSDENRYSYDDYTFIEQLCYDSKTPDGEWIVSSQFPEHFNMFGYHDKSCTLFFLGYYNGDPDNEEKRLAETDFPAFLKAVYAEYYD